MIWTSKEREPTQWWETPCLKIIQQLFTNKTQKYTFRPYSCTFQCIKTAVEKEYTKLEKYEIYTVYSENLLSLAS